MLLTIFLIIIFLSFLILVHELGHFAAAKLFGLRVDEFGLGFPPKLCSKKIGETKYSLNWFPIGGFVKILGEEADENAELSVADRLRNFSYQPAWKRLLIIVAGIFMNFLFGWVFLSLVFIIGSSQVLVITDVQGNSPAVLAGLEKNDQILEVAIGGEILKNPTKTEEFIDFINRFRGRDFAFKISRGGEIKNLTVGSRVDPPAGQGSIGIGILSAGIERQGFFTGLKGGFNLTIEAAETIFKAVYRLVRGAPEGSEVLQTVVGPVGIFSIASQANALGFVYFLQLIGLISVNLAVINIIPFPALDGGRAFFILLEKVKGSRFKVRTEKLANAIGISVLLALMALITGRDIWRLL